MLASKPRLRMLSQLYTYALTCTGGSQHSVSSNGTFSTMRLYDYCTSSCTVARPGVAEVAEVARVAEMAQWAAKQLSHSADAVLAS